MIFSIIVPFLNESNYIERCAISLLEQDFDKNEYEIIFVDNGSTDGSADTLRKFQRIILLREEKKGSCAARNRGLSIAKGDIIAFTDADCILCRDWLSRIYEGMTKYDATIALGKRFFPPNSSLPLKLFEDYENCKLEYLTKRYPEKVTFGSANDMAIRAVAFKRFGNLIEFPPEMGDAEFVGRCVCGDPRTKVIYLPGMQMTHLEVSSVWIWLKKMRDYGSRGGLAKGTHFYRHKVKIEGEPNRDIDLKTRSELYHYCAKIYRYGIIKRILSFIFLATGMSFYKFGYLIGRIKALFINKIP